MILRFKTLKKALPNSMLLPIIKIRLTNEINTVYKDQEIPME